MINIEHGVSEKIDNLIDSLHNMPLQEMTDIILTSIDTNFEVGGRPKWQAKKNGEPSFLQKTGALRENMQPMIVGSTIIIDNPLEYANFIQEGTSRMPSRIFMNIQDIDVDKIENLIKQHVGESVK